MVEQEEMMERNMEVEIRRNIEGERDYVLEDIASFVFVEMMFDLFGLLCEKT